MEWRVRAPLPRFNEPALKRGTEPKISICAIPVCRYVGSMNWQQFLLLILVLGVAVVFVWRSSGKSSGGKCGCHGDCGHDHDHDHESESKKEKAAR